MTSSTRHSGPSSDSAEETDAELVARWANGDAEAGGRFAQRHFATLWTYFRNKVDDAPDDLIQATLVECQRFGEHFARARNVRAYLLSIARSQLRAYYRRLHPTQCLDEISLQELESTLGTKLARRRRRDAVTSALRTLSLAHQEILELHYWSELSVSEIAELLGIPSGTVKSRLIRARQALSERLRQTAAIDESLRSVKPSPTDCDEPSGR